MTTRADAPRARVLVVDDESTVRRSLARALLARGYEVDTAESGQAALNLLRTRPANVALVDRDMPGIDGPALLTMIRMSHPAVEVVLMTAPLEVEALAAAALEAGAFAVVAKPSTSPDAVSLAVARAAERGRLLDRARALNEELADHQGFGELIGGSPGMRTVYAKALDAARTLQPVMILGERGTGKELFARAIHRNSNRASARLHVVSCSGNPADRIDDELFGTAEAGSSPRPGAFELAHGGTLLLDEIGELPLSTQQRLSKALAAGEVRPRGGAPRPIDARILATSHDLRERVASERFREDLYYRLSVVSLTLPALRRRREDIPVLAYHFVHRFASREGRTIRRITAEALRKLRDYRWPGNVRELERAVERAVVMARGDVLMPVDFELDDEVPRDEGEAERAAEAVVLSSGDLTEVIYAAAKDVAIDTFDRAYVSRLMERTGGNQSDAAKLAGMDRSNFRRLMKKTLPPVKGRKKR